MSTVKNSKFNKLNAPPQTQLHHTTQQCILSVVQVTVCYCMCILIRCLSLWRKLIEPLMMNVQLKLWWMP